VAGDEQAREAEGSAETVVTTSTELVRTRGDQQELRDVSFSVSWRGYDRGQVDAYVEQVNRTIAELEVGRSPEAAIRHALEQVGEQTAGILRQAGEAAEELTSAARGEAEHAARRAKVEAGELMERTRAEAKAVRERSAQEAQELLEQARAQAGELLRTAEQRVRERQQESEERLRELAAKTEAAKVAHGRVLEDLHRTAMEIEQLASGAHGRPGETHPPTGRQRIVARPAHTNGGGDAAAAREPSEPDPDATREMPRPRGGSTPS
jgi:DivIVA domain-containing protein